MVDDHKELVEARLNASLASDLHDDATALEVLATVLPRNHDVGPMLRRISERVRSCALTLAPDSAPEHSAEDLLAEAGYFDMQLSLALPRGNG